MTIEQKETPNYRKGRRNPVLAIAIHVTEGTAESAASWFKTGTSSVSSNYLVTKLGAIWQFVSEEDEAWAQGRVDKPTAAVVLENPGKNPNSYCISIEHEGDGTKDLTDAQRNSSAWLIQDICGRHNLQINRDTVIGHHEIYSKKTCPGKIDVDKLVQAARDYVEPSVSIPDPPVVWSEYLNDWLIITKVDGDEDWWFMPLKAVKVSQHQARGSVSLSSMPRKK